MGFTDRFKEAAEAARSSLQDTRLGGANTIRGVQAVAPPVDDIAIARRAQALGAPDPYTLIHHDEVVALTGLPVGGPFLTWADDDVGIKYVAEDGRGRAWTFGVHAGHAHGDGAPFDAASWYRWMVQMLDGAETVPGLGDDAIYRDGLLYVLSGRYAYYVHVEAPEGSPVRRWAAALARRVLDRLVSGEAG
ncbi:MAG TPA: hypothetical protein VK306_15015 [Acidimicrobiales bacterium]|nr:hypothetical protein [Acidimicrobiales bacterium]